MATPQVPTIDTAIEIARVAASDRRVSAVAVFGSVARGDADERSDIDLLVVGSANLRPTQIRSRIPSDLESCFHASLACHTRRDLRALERLGAIFVTHLRRDAVVLMDQGRWLTRFVSSTRTSRINVPRELQRQRERVSPYRSARAFAGYYDLALGHLYAIGKSVAMIRLAALGDYEFNRERIFEKMVALDSRNRTPVRILRSFKPFYDQQSTLGRLTSPGTRDQLAAGVAAVDFLIEGSTPARSWSS